MLKHLPFFEAVGSTEEGSPGAKVATAGLLLMRLIDHWVLAGMVMVEPESASVHSVRAAISELEPGNPQRDVLFGIINAMQSSRRVDVEPLFPRLNRYARLLELDDLGKKLAVDVDYSVARLSSAGGETPESKDLLDEMLRFMFGPRSAGEPRARKTRKRKRK
jgi:hypothetical protein